MYLGRVIGTVVATQKYAGLEGVRLLVVEPLNDRLVRNGEYQVAADATRQAGPKDLVYLVGSREAALALEETFVPVDAAIIGIVDEVNRDEGRPSASFRGPAPSTAAPASTIEPTPTEAKPKKGKR